MNKHIGIKNINTTSDSCNYTGWDGTNFREPIRTTIPSYEWWDKAESEGKGIKKEIREILDLDEECARYVLADVLLTEVYFLGVKRGIRDRKVKRESDDMFKKIIGKEDEKFTLRWGYVDGGHLRY